MRILLLVVVSLFALGCLEIPKDEESGNGLDQNLIAIPFLAGGLLGIPEGVTPVNGFDLNQYLGKWYEIARLDHPFERGLQQVSAEYSLRTDGAVRVLNSGFSTAENVGEEAVGEAYFVDDQNTGYLKVSFFVPFYSSYVIFELDQDYQYSFVAGADKSTLWLLSRTATITDELRDQFLTSAGNLGFDTDSLIWVEHE